jgi:hypothetical protein
MSLSLWDIAQHEMQKEAGGGRTTRNTLVMQWREIEMD